MTVALTTNSLAEIFKRSSNDAFLRLLEIEHSTWTPTVERFTNNKVNVANAGGSNQTYEAIAFEIEPPHDLNEVSRVRLLIDNTQRRMMAKVRSIASRTPAQVTLKLVLASAPNTLIRPAWVMEARQVQYTASGIALTCLFNVLCSEVVPMHVMNPARNPGLYKESE